jgi:hypothetical protein
MGINQMIWEQDLVRDIRTGHRAYDDADGGLPHPRGYDGRVEFSDCNRANLETYFGKVRDNCRAILEIGVCRNGSASSTHVFLNNKLLETVYVGIDLDDKSFLNDPAKNIHTIQNTSSDIEGNMAKIKALGVEQFDFIFIDGWHSINQVLIDWEYTQWLGPTGIVGFHDVSCHPGPNQFVKAMNIDKWTVIINTCPDDWGIGFAWKR